MTLCGIQLPLEGHDLLQLRRARRGRHLEMAQGRRDRLPCQRCLAGIRHHVHLQRLPALRIARRRLAVLRDERTDAEVVGDDVLEVGHRAGTPVHGDRRRTARQSVFRMGVAAGRIAHHFDRELGLDRRAIRAPGGPGQRDAEQAALQEQRMRRGVVLREARTIAAVDCREDRIPPVRLAPPRLDGRPPTRSCRRRVDGTSRTRAHCGRWVRRTRVLWSRPGQPC